MSFHGGDHALPTRRAASGRLLSAGLCRVASLPPEVRRRQASLSRHGVLEARPTARSSAPSYLSPHLMTPTCKDSESPQQLLHNSAAIRYCLFCLQTIIFLFLDALLHGHWKEHIKHSIVRKGPHSPDPFTTRIGVWWVSVTWAGHSTDQPLRSQGSSVQCLTLSQSAAVD